MPRPDVGERGAVRGRSHKEETMPKEDRKPGGMGGKRTGGAAKKAAAKKTAGAAKKTAASRATKKR